MKGGSLAPCPEIACALHQNKAVTINDSPWDEIGGVQLHGIKDMADYAQWIGHFVHAAVNDFFAEQLLHLGRLRVPPWAPAPHNAHPALMLYNIKALIVVLAIAATVFHLAKPIALQFISGDDFLRRRLVWFVLTAVSFVSPNIWLYALIAVPMLVWANRNDSNPIALYLLMLHVIPPVGVIIPILGNNGLFPLDNYRLLALCVLLPAAIRYRKNEEEATAGRLGAMDVLLLAFGALQVALYTPPDLPHHLLIPDSPSNVLRRAVLFFLDTYLLYFTVTRTCQSRRKMVDAAATFCLACAVMAAIAMFEHIARLVALRRHRKPLGKRSPRCVLPDTKRFGARASFGRSFDSAGLPPRRRIRLLALSQVSRPKQKTSDWSNALAMGRIIRSNLPWLMVGCGDRIFHISRRRSACSIPHCKGHWPRHRPRGRDPAVPDR